MRTCALLVSMLAACGLQPAEPSPMPPPGQTELTVLPLDDATQEAPPFDRELVAAVEERLRLDPEIDASRVAVDADDGRVHLFGTVTSDAQKERAIEIAWVAGVTDVDASALDVWPFREPGGSEAASPEPEPAPPDDETRTEPGEVVFGPDL